MSPAAGSDIRATGDLDSRAAIHDLVVGFYREIVFDDLLEPVFQEVAEVDWAVHIPKLIDYWCRVLLRQPGYAGSILEAHQYVHRREPLEPEHFDRWYTLWVASVDSRWSGPKAELAKDHAARIGKSLDRRLRGDDWVPPGPPGGPAAEVCRPGEGDSSVAPASGCLR